MRLWVWEWVANSPALSIPFFFFYFSGDKSAHTLTRTPTPPPNAASLQRPSHGLRPCGCPRTNTSAQLVCFQTMTHAET